MILPLLSPFHDLSFVCKIETNSIHNQMCSIIPTPKILKICFAICRTDQIILFTIQFSLFIPLFSLFFINPYWSYLINLCMCFLFFCFLKSLSCLELKFNALFFYCVYWDFEHCSGNKSYISEWSCYDSHVSIL